MTEESKEKSTNPGDSRWKTKVGKLLGNINLIRR